MMLTVKEVQTRKEREIFIKIPELLHKNHKNWVPPIYSDDRNFFNPYKNKYFRYSDVVLVIALKDEIPVGRIMGIINHRYNDLHLEHHARFCFMESTNDPDVFHALIEFIEHWGCNKGMTHLVGPLGFSDKDPQGFMVEGFGEPLVLATNGNHPYMPQLLEKEGYTKKVDCVVYKVAIPSKIPEFYQSIYNRTMERTDVEIINVKGFLHMRSLIKPVFRLLNETFKDIYAFVPFEEYEMSDYANRYLPLLDPNFIKVAINSKKEIVGFIIAMPDIGKGIIAAKGKLFPLGFIKILRSKRKTKQLDLMLGAVREDYRGKGVDVAMGVKMLESAWKRGMEFIDSHLELETNTKMRMEMEKIGGVVYKRYRIFQKPL
jgi:hypothetical protein